MLKMFFPSSCAHSAVKQWNFSHPLPLPGVTEIAILSWGLGNCFDEPGMKGDGLKLVSLLG
jgi:hypothetical protein